MDGIRVAATQAWTDPRQRMIWSVVTALAVAMVFAFWDAFAGFLERWGSEPELSHSYFLPAVSAWMLWERRDALSKSVGAPVALGFVVAAGSLLFTFAGAVTHVALAEQIGFIGLLIALPLILGGWSLWQLCLIPLAYLVFMVPPPKMMITLMSQSFQLMSSELGVWLIRLFGIPVYLSGNVIELSSTKLEVVEACSGLRYLFPFLSLGALAAYFYQGPIWQRIILFLSTIPITIFMNSFRIAMTGVLIEKFGGNHTDGFVHAFEGWMVFVLCIVFLLGVIWILTLMRGEKKPLAFVGFEDVKPKAPRAPWSTTAFLRHGVIVTALVMLTGILNHTIGNRDLIIPERLRFDTLPLEFPAWRSRTTPLSEGVVDVLGADDYIITDMFGPENQYINLYIAYLEARREGKAWHSPLQCLPGGGWDVQMREPIKAETHDGKPFTMNRMIIRQKDTEMLVHFWYDHRGRKIANEFSMRAFVVWDDLTRRRSDGAMVRLMTRIMPDESMDDASARLVSMQHDLEKVLPKYVPH